MINIKVILAQETGSLSSLSDLTPILFNMEVSHLGLEAAICVEKIASISEIRNIENS